jgi:hypothetical protein
VIKFHDPALVATFGYPEVFEEDRLAVRLDMTEVTDQA